MELAKNFAEQIKFTSNPRNDYVNSLAENINAENLDYGNPFRFGFFLKISNKIIAGAHCKIFYASLYTNLLWVDQDYRNNGIASEIMHKAHEFAKSQNCNFASLNTMSFQRAKGFYEIISGLHKFLQTINYLYRMSINLLKHIRKSL